MIINPNTSNFDNLSAAPVKKGKTNSHHHAKSASDTQSSSASEELAVSQNNLTAVDSEIPNTDSANAMMETLRQAILGQPSLAMLAQASSVGPGAARLLQQ